MVYNNRNTSPTSKMENEFMQKVFISYSNDINDLDDVFDIGNYLEKEGLISGFNLDRIDNKDTSKEHYNFYFNSNVNNNSLDKIIKDYIQKREIDYTKIKQLKEELQMGKEYKISAIADKCESSKLGFKDLDDLKDVLNIKENNDLKYIGMDSNLQTNIKDIGGNIGKGRDKIPERLSFSVFFDKDLNLDDKDEDLKKELEKTLAYFEKDTSLLKPTFSIDGNILNLEFNNVLKNPNSKEYYLLGAQQYKKRLEAFLSSYLSKKDLTLTTNKFYFYNNEDKIKELYERNNEPKTFKNEIKKPFVNETKTFKEVEKSEVKEVLKSEVKEVEKTPKNINVDFVNQVARFKSVEDFETLKDDLKSDLENMEKAKKFIPNFEEQFKEVTNKINLLDIKKDEFIKQNDKDNKIKELESSLNEIINMNEVLEKDVKVLSNDKNELTNKLETKVKEINELNEVLENKVNEIKTLSNDKNELNNTLETKVKEVESLSNIKDELTNKLGTKVKEFTELESNLKDKVKENISLNNELNETKIEVEKAIDVISSLQKSVLDLNNNLTNVSLKLERTTLEKNELMSVINVKDEQLEQYRNNNSNYLDRLEKAMLRVNELEKEIRHTNNNLGLDNLENLAKNKIEELADKLNSKDFDEYVKNTLQEKGTFSDVLKTLNIEKDERGNIKNISTIDSNNETFEKKPNETKINNIDE